MWRRVVFGRGVLRSWLCGLLAALAFGVPFSLGAAAQDGASAALVVPVSQWQVDAVAYSPDGRFLVTGGNGTVYLWNVETGELLRSFVGHEGWVGEIAFAPDGQHFATGGYDKVPRIWRMDRATPSIELEPLEETISALAFSADGNTLAAADSEGGISVWTFGENGSRRTVDVEDSTEALGFEEEYGSLIFVGRHGVRSIELETMEVASPYADTFGTIWSAAFLKDGESLIIGIDEGPLQLWNIRSGEMVRSFAGAPASNYWVLVSPDGKTAVASLGVVDEGEQVVYWDVEKGVETGQGKLAERIPTLTVSPDGKSVAVAVDGGVEIRDFATGATSRFLHGATYSGETIDAVAGTAVTSANHRARIWSLEDGKVVSELEANRIGAVLSPDASFVLAGSFASGSPVQIWDAAAGTLRSSVDLQESLEDEEVDAVSFSGDGTRAALYVGIDLAMVDTATGESVAMFESDALMAENDDDFVSFRSVALAPDGARVVIADTSPKVQIRAADQTWEVVRSLKGLAEWVREVRYSPDGTLIAGVDQLDQVLVWNAKNGKVVRKFEVPDDVVQGLEFTPDSALLAARMGSELRVWSIKSGKRVADAAFAGDAAEVVYDSEAKRFDVLTQEGTIVHLSSGAEPKVLATTLNMQSGGFVTVTPDGFFDGPENLLREFRLSSGLNAYSIDGALSVLHRPDLVAAALDGDPDGLVAEAAAELDFAALVADADPIGGAFEPIPRTPTHVIIAEAIVRDEADAAGTDVAHLAPGTTVALVAESEVAKWSQIARDGKILGFTETANLAPLQ